MPKKRKGGSLQLSQSKPKKNNRTQEKDEMIKSSDLLKCDDCGEGFSISYNHKVHTGEQFCFISVN